MISNNNHNKNKSQPTNVVAATPLPKTLKNVSNPSSASSVSTTTPKSTGEASVDFWPPFSQSSRSSMSVGSPSTPEDEYYFNIDEDLELSDISDIEVEQLENLDDDELNIGEESENTLDDELDISGIVNLLDEADSNNTIPSSDKTFSNTSNLLNTSLKATHTEDDMNDPTSLYHYIPYQIADNYKHKSLYPWQVALLENNQILDGGKNIIYSSPTSGGKTLVSEIIMVRRLTRNKSKVVFMLPFKAIIEEKVADLNEKFKNVGWKANPYHSEAVKLIDTASFNDDDERVMVCTFERGNSILNGLIRTGKIDEIGTIIIDELHSITEPDRGYILELILTKIIYLKPKIQIIAMSATLPNVDKLASFLNAYLFVTDYRPVPLSEYMVHDSKVFDTNCNLVRNLTPYTVSKKLPDGFNISILSLIDTEFATIIFCSSKLKCKLFAKFIAEENQPQHIPEHLVQQRQELLTNLKLSTTGLDPDLNFSMGRGVGFHHSSLTMEEKKLVELAFRNGMIKILLCTTTLATGVNLPARRVIISSLTMGRDDLSIVNYKQAAGRAGRAGIDVKGESYLIVPSLESGSKLLSSKFTPMKSCLNEKHISRALLENISTGIIRTAHDIVSYLKCTFLSKCIPEKELRSIGINSKVFLEKNGFIRWINGKDSFDCKPLGFATQIANICPYLSLKFYQTIKNELKNFYLEDDLGMIYILASFSENSLFHTDYNDTFSKVAEKIVNIAIKRREFSEFVNNKIRDINELRGYILSVGNRSSHQRELSETIYTLRKTFILYDIILEYPIKNIAETYFGDSDARGSVQNVQKDAASKASVLSSFCKYAALPSFFSEAFKEIKERLVSGVRQELVPLVQIPFVGSSRARLLFSAGLRTIAQVADETPESIENILVKGSQNTTESRTKANLIVEGAKAIVEEKLLPLEWIFGPQDEDTFLFQNSSPKKRGKKRCNAFDDNQAEHKKKKEDSVIELKLGDNQLFDEFLERWNNSKVFSFCFEFGIKKKQDNPTTFIKNRDVYTVKGLSICFNEVFEDYLTFEKRCETKIDPNIPCKCYFIHLDDYRSKIVKRMLQDKRKPKLTFGFKKQQTRLLQAWDLIVKDPVLDPMIGDWVQHPDDSDNEKTLEEIYLKYFPSDSFLFTPKNDKFVIVKTASQCWPIMTAVMVSIINLELRQMFEFEMSFSKVLSTMEHNGIRFNYHWIKHNTKLIDAKLDEITRDLNSLQILDGKKIDVSNNDHVALLLFDKLKLKGTERKTNKEILEKLKKLYPDKSYIMKQISEYRYLLNIKTHHIQNMPNDIKYCPDTQEYRIFASQMQTTSATGRLSVKNPNLQNIPNDIDIKDPFSQKSIITLSIRSAFIPRNGYVMVSIDYKNIELRILAHLSQDRTLSDILSNTERDIFEEIARNFWNFRPEEPVPLSHRSLVKQIIYGISYCMGSETLSGKMFNSENEDFMLRPGEDRIEAAERYKQNFFEKYQGLKQYKDFVENHLVEKHYVETSYSRKRFIHDICSDDSSKRAAARRAALNTVSQGSASDIMKIVMLGIYSFMRHFNKKEERAYMLLQIHDELLFEVREDSLSTFIYCTKNIMQNTDKKLLVPLPVKVQIGDSWGTLKDYPSSIPLTNEEKDEIRNLSVCLGFDWKEKLGVTDNF
ncbi:predicted protein [Naegleria gruberi]|uniref:Predicted protein n=1 Tax=Naegleria gruberi TaxID=5762 RepID=D2V2V4_NAEGR|nr:uncharacterized protein NAEGRDRAFT_46260 [Naegleria gruberi]EFC49126.1 predicted protein [Naegleria gruberi]|eukprot:XP_002681870.1 predicted protein [Naegleria gruberi strain NEG-M]